MDLSNQDAGGSVEDRRGNTGKLAAGGGVVALLVALVAGYFGIDPRVAQQLAGNLAGGGQQQKGEPPADGYLKFSKQILQSTNEVWEKQFPQNFGQRYKPPEMVLFSEQVDSEGCGIAPSSVGPFYCPRSRKVFLDPTFFTQLERDLGGSKAEFSQAYVIGHEVGHHVQNLLGYNARVDDFKRREGENSGIRLELQADYLAGVWAHHVRTKLKINDRDISEAIKTAKSIGDDRIQKKSRGWASPESFNHGTSEQRLKYFMRGYETGDASKRALDHFFDPSIKPLAL
jgi:predicted metalloprotease